MTTTINASTSNGLVQSADGSGIIKLQSNGVTTNALAWVNFNGTGTVAIRSSYNVSSITDNGTGNYTVNFANALSDANYSAVLGAQGNTSASNNGYATLYPATSGNMTQTTSIVQIRGVNGANALADLEVVCLSVFGN